jgi:hypothetical protein
MTLSVLSINNQKSQTNIMNIELLTAIAEPLGRVVTVHNEVH